MYKRQDEYIATGQIQFIEDKIVSLPKWVWLLIMPEYIPVSYTHLDVYKRQAQFNPDKNDVMIVPEEMYNENIRSGSFVVPYMGTRTFTRTETVHYTFPSHHKMCIRDRYKRNIPLFGWCR